MYKTLNIVPEAEKLSESKILKERNQYLEFLIAGENFIIANKLIIFGKVATKLLLLSIEDKPEINSDSFQYEIYSDNILTHARELTNILFNISPNGLGRYTSMNSDIPNYLITISVNSRQLFRFISTQRTRGMGLFDVIVPSIRNTQFTKNENDVPYKIKCAGSELQLLDVYSNLCSPSLVNEWPTLLKIERPLLEVFFKEIKSKIAQTVEIAGGGNDYNNKIKLHDYVLHNFASGSNRVVLGSMATSIMNNSKFKGRLQIVTANTLKNEIDELVKIASNYGLKLTWSVDDPKIPNNQRARKVVIYILTKNNKESLIDIYNSASYSLIPYITVDKLSKITGIKYSINRNIKIGSPFIVIYYLLVEIWIIQLITHLGSVPVEISKKILFDMVSNIRTASEFYDNVREDKKISVTDKINILLPVSNYVGYFENYTTSLRRKHLDKVKYPPYFPLNKNTEIVKEPDSMELSSKVDQFNDKDIIKDLLDNKSPEDLIESLADSLTTPYVESS